LNVTTSLAGTVTLSPVLGLRARLGFRRLISNTPKFRNSMRPSLSSVSMIPSNTRCTMSNACAWVTPNSPAIAVAMSLLVMGYPCRGGGRLPLPGQHPGQFLQLGGPDPVDQFPDGPDVTHADIAPGEGLGGRRRRGVGGGGRGGF